MRIGYTLMTEQSGPKDLVRWAVGAEEAGFDFEVMSDHYFPWLSAQGHAPYAWSVLGAVAHATERVDLMTYVTCPTIRYHPAVVAQKAATVQLLADGRFTLGLGSGENLNEHVVGERWPAVATRQDMLEEAIEVIRALHTGELVDHHGEHFRVESARIWDLPEGGVPIGVAVSGEESIARFAPLADHLIAVEPKAELRGGRGTRRPRAPRIDGARTVGRAIGQIPICWDPDEKAAVERAHDQFRWFAGGWRSTPTCRRRPASPAATQFVRPEDVAESIPCGPDLDAIAEAVAEFDEAGLHRPGPRADRRRAPGAVPRRGRRTAAGAAARPARES